MTADLPFIFEVEMFELTACFLVIEIEVCHVQMLSVNMTNCWHDAGTLFFLPVSKHSKPQTLQLKNSYWFFEMASITYILCSSRENRV